MRKRRILIAEESEQLQNFFDGFFREHRYEPFFSTGMEETLKAVGLYSPDFLILNLMRPKPVGLEVCKRLRAHYRTRDIPILIVSEVAGEEDRIAGFKMGVDDYLAIPFQPNELLLRLKAIERRCNPPLDKSTTLEIGDVVVDTEAATVSVQGKEVSLSSREYRLLTYLMRRKGCPQTKDTLLAQIWESPADSRRMVEIGPTVETSRAIEVQVQRLRSKIAPADNILGIIRRVGYVAWDPELD